MELDAHFEPIFKVTSTLFFCSISDSACHQRTDYAPDVSLYQKCYYKFIIIIYYF